jgi:hypothetical protein
MTVTASTTIAGVSVLAGGEPSGDPFDIAISNECIEIRRTGQQPRRMSWDRVSEWELEERADHVVLTFRGEGAATPLLVTGWSVEDLEVLLRTVTSAADAEHNGAFVATATTAAVETGSAVRAAPASVPVAEVEPPPVETRRQRRRTRRLRVSGKAVLTIALLVVLATAVTLVLLQSAGIIDWAFLGPTA